VTLAFSGWADLARIVVGRLEMPVNVVDPGVPAPTFDGDRS
jgi:hypothetical protein